MRWLSFLILFLVCGCRQNGKKSDTHKVVSKQNVLLITTSQTDTSYADAKKRIALKRKELSIHRLQVNTTDKTQIKEAITNCWVSGISSDLYKYWAGTAWDFNGTTRIPRQGTIACGYFVTTLLLDMGMKLNRIKLSTCAASQMMHRLVPHQKMKVLNGLPYNLFCDSLKHLGKGVYIIGLDFHVGFIVNDGLNYWFIHSNYINKQGVVKELVQLSTALKASNTRWLIGLTSDKDFIDRWLKGESV